MQNVDEVAKVGGAGQKIYLATNIAETSITLDKIAYVIDCGTAKAMTVDYLGVEELVPQFISKVC